MADGGRILATDDRPEIQRLIERTLGSKYECEFANDVAAAREKLSRGSFDLALCDIEMPGESGLTLAEEIVTDHPQTAVVLVTGQDDPAVAAKALDFGVHGYLVKPFWPGQLLITAMSALRRHELELEVEGHAKTMEEHLQLLLDRAPLSIFMLDTDRRFVLANRVAHEIAGLAPNAMIGMHSSEVLSPEAEREVLPTDRAVLGDRMTFEEEETLLVDDRTRTFLTVKFPYLDGSGGVAGIYGISRDITDRKQAERLREELSRAQQLAIEELQASRQETVDRLSRAIERHDLGTGRHINRMATVAALLGQRSGLPPNQVLLLRAAAPMHDIGKVATPDAILRKPGLLTPTERAEMEKHAMAGYEILAGSDGELVQMAARIALTHHEHWDGGGYPRGLRGEEIPIEGRIVAVADVFDALLSDRPYRPAMELEEALEVIRQGRESHFDPAIVDTLLENVAQAVMVRG